MQKLKHYTRCEIQISLIFRDCHVLHLFFEEVKLNNCSTKLMSLKLLQVKRLSSERIIKQMQSRQYIVM